MHPESQARQNLMPVNGNHHQPLPSDPDGKRPREENNKRDSPEEEETKTSES